MKLSKITGVRNITDYGCFLLKKILSNAIIYLTAGYKSVGGFIGSNGRILFSEPVAMTGGLVTVFLLCFTAMEIKLHSLPRQAADMLAYLLVAAAGCLVWLLLSQWKLVNRNRSIQVSNIELESRNLRLERDLNELVTHSNIASAVIDSISFDCFFTNISKLFRNDEKARSLVFFGYFDNKVYPQIYYQFSEYSELRLNFSKNDNLSVTAGRVFDKSLLSAGKLKFAVIDDDLTVTGKLFYDNEISGNLSMTLFGSELAANLQEDYIIDILSRILVNIDISAGNISEVIESSEVSIYSQNNENTEMAVRLDYAETVLGIIQINYCRLAYQDYLKKQRILVNTARSISKILYHDKIYQLAIRDGLTELYNKRYLLEALQQHFSLFLRNRVRFSLILLDIDFFKKVNDTWGHVTGDIVLKRVAEIVSGALRDADIPARYGGEELAVLLPETSSCGAEKVAERIRKNIFAEKFVAENGEVFSISASFGVVESGMEMINAGCMISFADRALYKAKDSGRNMVIISEGSEENIIIDVA